MTLLSSQPKPLESAPTGDSPATAGTGSEDPELRMLEKRSKVIEELLQTERDYKKDLQMCVEEIIKPLQKKQVSFLQLNSTNCEGVARDWSKQKTKWMLVGVEVACKQEEIWGHYDPERKLGAGSLKWECQGKIGRVGKCGCLWETLFSFNGTIKSLTVNGGRDSTDKSLKQLRIN